MTISSSNPRTRVGVLRLPVAEFTPGDVVRLDDGREGMVFRRAFGLSPRGGARLIDYDVKILGGPLVTVPPHRVFARFAGTAA